MASFPPLGSVTICEINRVLITAENLSDDRAKETYAKVLGVVLSPVSFPTDHLISSPSPDQGLEQQGRSEESGKRNSWSTALWVIFSDSLKRLFHPSDPSYSIRLYEPRFDSLVSDSTLPESPLASRPPVTFESEPRSAILPLGNAFPSERVSRRGAATLKEVPATKVKLLPEVDLHGVSWHHHKHILAFISGPNHVTIRDYEDSEGKEPFILTNESQRDVKLLEWRPNGGRTLSVACKQVSKPLLHSHWVEFAYGRLLIQAIQHMSDLELPLAPYLVAPELDGLS
ncbi:transducin/WD40 repeat-like superfamily protein [Actinidia rufa]|uniref:Transducin/WD40 repeat-like superfamily protein n=1 Tax=Actinidia rufa TaxID=165716 RepID=A0A7J0GEV7_9ERIC|nr:transducin/WD40 repeat-like superfamily protein [Actinidia rufa]